MSHRHHQPNPYPHHVTQNTGQSSAYNQHHQLHQTHHHHHHQQQQHHHHQHHQPASVQHHQQHPQQQVYQPLQQQPQHQQQVYQSHQHPPQSQVRQRQHIPTREEHIQRLRQLRKDFFKAPAYSPQRYHVQQIIGEGASGVVCKAKDMMTGEVVAVKRVSRGFTNVRVSVRLLRELKFLRILRAHSNIVELKGLLLPDPRQPFDDMFLVFELMPTDLEHLMRSHSKLSADHILWFMFQLLHGIHFMHSAGVFHRDLKPNNILIKENCELRICDFGLARAAFDDVPDMVYWTDYVATRWYRAPELIMTHYTKYNTSIDIWSAGCIFAEMLSQGQPLFPGKDGYHQLHLMTDVLGSPSEEALSKVQSDRVREHFRSLPRKHRPPLANRFPDADAYACDLLEWMLDFDPARRPSAAEALKHPYFAGLHSMGPPVHAKAIDPKEFDFERHNISAEEMKQMFMREIMIYHPEQSREYFADRGGFDMPSQATTFANGMRSLEEGIAQRKTTSMPKEQFAAFCEKYRAKRQARMAQGGEGSASAQQDATTEAGGDEMMTDVPASPGEAGKRRRRGKSVTSTSWYGGTSANRKDIKIEKTSEVVLADDPLDKLSGVHISDEIDSPGIVRVSSIRAKGSSSSYGVSSGTSAGKTEPSKFMNDGRP